MALDQMLWRYLLKSLKLDSESNTGSWRAMTKERHDLEKS